MTTLTRTFRLLSITAIAAIVALGALIALPATSNAAAAGHDRQGRNYYGAIAISNDQAWGVSYDYGTKRAAKSHALRQCRNHTSQRCYVTVWVRNGCAATAVKTNHGTVTRYSWGIGRSPRQAKARALSELSAPKKILTWVCTTR